MFRKGQSGNPKGRPKKDKALSNILERYLEEKDHEEVKAKDRLARKLVELAIEGSIPAMKMIFDRVEGPVNTFSMIDDESIPEKITVEFIG